MFELYEERKSAGKQPVKLSMYNCFFNNELNITFHVQKSDRCNTCELLEKSNSESIDQPKYQKHVCQKNLMREKKDKDKSGDIPSVIV